MGNNQDMTTPANGGAPAGGKPAVVKKKKQKHGGFARFTYFIALLCLIAGLALPLDFNFENYLENTLFWQLPAALNTVAGQDILSFGAPACLLTYPVNIWGALSFDLGAYLFLLYALFTVLGILILIILLFSKKALAKVSFIEGFALLALLPLVYIQLVYATVFSALGAEYSWKLFAPLFIAAGGTLLMVILQAFAYKKGSGFIKLILFLFSGIALVGCIYPVTALVPALEGLLDSLANMFGGMFSATSLFEGFDGVIEATVLFSSDYWASLESLELMNKVMYLAALAVSILAFVNFTLDTLGLAKKTKKYMLVFNVLRYLLTLLAAGTVIALGFINGVKLGLPILLIAVLAFLAFLINCIRAGTYTKRKKAELARQRKQQQLERKQQLYGRPSGNGYTNDAAAAKAYFQNADERRANAQAEREKRKQEKQAERDKAKAEREAALQAAEEKPAAAPKANEEYYNVKQIYKGPTDEFIKELTNDEKIEFAKVFLERSEDVMTDIPEYVIGGNNDKFFSSVFIYYGRICDRISGGLMNKIYECGYRK